jgi:Rrf2 family protein
MRLGEGVEWGLHCVVVLATLPPGQALPAARLAEFHGVPPAYLAKTMQALAAAGVVESVVGPRGGYRLARPVAEVTVLDVVEAVDPEPSTFRCTEIRRRGPAAVPAREYRVPCAIHTVMDKADRAWRAELEATTIADLIGLVAAGISPKAVEKTVHWLQEVLR